MYCVNFDIEKVVTPINVRVYEDLLWQSGYPPQEINTLVNGFRYGFDIGYRGPMRRKDKSNNIPFQKGVGDKIEMWNKIMKEVGKGRYAGPYREEEIPFEYFVQSPIGLVPKANGQTRLIFHLSYDFPDSGQRSINHHTPKELCKVKYKDLDYAVRCCLRMIKCNPNCELWLGISDLQSAFRVIPTLRKFWPVLMMKAVNPLTGETVFLIDKNLPFGNSRSCQLFQQFSDSLAHIFMYKARRLRNVKIVNYLDDFLFIGLSQSQCNEMVRLFDYLCKIMNVPIAKEKTIYATQQLVFLGILIDGHNRVLSLPVQKREKALYYLEMFAAKKKATVKEIQVLTGVLNFMCKAIHPGRAFTRRMYDRIVGQINSKGLCRYHHLNLDSHFRSDCLMWKDFLIASVTHPMMYCRPFADINDYVDAQDIGFFTDATANKLLGAGGILGSSYFAGRWEPGYIEKFKPSIAYLELLAVCTGVFIWSKRLRNLRIVVHCDNLSVVGILNKSTSRCIHCMDLVRRLILNNLKMNIRIFGQHIEGSKKFHF